MNLPTTLVLMATACTWADQDEKSQSLKVDPVLVTLIHQVAVPARDQGAITEVAAEIGKVVKKGATLAQIDDAGAQLAKNQAAIELEHARMQAKNDVGVRLAKKTLELAKADLDRARRSRKIVEGAVSDEEVERRKLAVDKATLELEQAEKDHVLAQHRLKFSENGMRVAERNLELRKIIAPIDGIVVQVNRRNGEWVEPGVPVMRVLRIDRLRAEGFLDASQINGDLTGRPVKLTLKKLNGKTSEFQGVLQFVSPEVSPVDGKVRVLAEIDNRDLRLRPGMRASMTIRLFP